MSIGYLIDAQVSIKARMFSSGTVQSMSQPGIQINPPLYPTSAASLRTSLATSSVVPWIRVE